MSREKELEELLSCSIIKSIPQGKSLEKYHAILNDQEVMLRLYDDDYYTNRFLREGLVLRQLVDQDFKIISPKIIDEWPEYQIRAIEWFDFKEKDLDDNDVQKVLSWIRSQNITLPYSLHEDLVTHLMDANGIHTGYTEFFETHVDLMLDEITWEVGDMGLVHGDLHHGNIGFDGDCLVVFDWEYATRGSHFYDIAYYDLVSGHKTSNRVPIEWSYLVALVNCHWYLQDENFSPKEAIQWVNLVGEISKKILTSAT